MQFRQENQIAINLADKQISSLSVLFQFIKIYSNQSCVMRIDLSKNAISSKMMQQMSELSSLSRPINVSHLLLHNNQIQNLGWMVHLKNISHLKHLHLQFNIIKSLDGIQNVNLSNLERISINNNRINDQAMHVLTQLYFPQLRILSIESNPISNQTAKKITNLKVAMLLYLNLSQTNISQIIFTESLFQTKMDKLIMKKSKLTSANFGTCNFQNLRTLDLQQNQIVSGQGLSAVMMNLANLETIDLSNNKLTHCRFIALMNAISLIQINMRNNRITNLSRKTFRQSKLGKLEGIFFTRNNLSGDYVQEIMVGLLKGPIKNISIWRNNGVSLRRNPYPIFKSHFKGLCFFEY